jgi:hypothetical protein
MASEIGKSILGKKFRIKKGSDGPNKADLMRLAINLLAAPDHAVLFCPRLHFHLSDHFPDVYGPTSSLLIQPLGFSTLTRDKNFQYSFLLLGEIEHITEKKRLEDMPEFVEIIYNPDKRTGVIEAFYERPERWRMPKLEQELSK